MKVVVLSGGRSSEHDVSLASGSAVAEGLTAAGHEAVPVLIDRDGRWLLDGADVQLVPGRGLLGADVAFPVLHGPFGEDGTVQGVLECLDVPYVGSGVLASAVCLDKVTFKRLLASQQISQVKFVVAGEPGWHEKVESLGTPIWVKPSRLGSSVGISKVTDPGELDAAVDAAAKHDPRVIIEEHCEGREVECSVLGNSEPETSPPGMIDAHADWYDQKAKYEAGGMDLLVPAPLEPATLERVRELAVRVFTLTGCSGLARCDFFVEGEDVLVSEINTLPGFTGTSVFAKLFEAAGVGYPQLCDRLVALAVERHSSEAEHSF